MQTDISRLTYMVSMPRQRQRFRELILYVSEKSKGDPNFGAVKLNKILYYSDFRAYERFGIPLTGVKYFRIKAGPAPKAMVPVLNEMIRENAVSVERRQVGNLTQKRTVALRPAVTEHFTKDELILVDEVIRELWGQTATEVSDASHDVRWRVLNDKDEIPYEFAYLSDDVTSQDEERTRVLAYEFGW